MGWGRGSEIRVFPFNSCFVAAGLTFSQVPGCCLLADGFYRVVPCKSIQKGRDSNWGQYTTVLFPGSLLKAVSSLSICLFVNLPPVSMHLCIYLVVILATVSPSWIVTLCFRIKPGMQSALNPL